MYAVGDTEATNEQRGKGNQDECCGNLIQPFSNTFAAFGEGGGVPVWFRERLFEVRQPRVQVLVGLHPIFVVYPAARPDQFRRLDRLFGNHDGQATPVGVQAAIRLFLNQAADTKRGCAYLNLIPYRLSQALGQQGVDHGAPSAILSFGEFGTRLIRR